MDTINLKKPTYLYDTDKKQWIVSVGYGHVNYSTNKSLAMHLTFIDAYEVAKQVKQLTENQLTFYQLRTDFDNENVLRTELRDVCSF